METNFFFKNTSDAEQTEVREYVEKKLGRLDRLTAHMPQDAVNLHVKCEKFEKHNAFEVEFVLTVPSNKFMAKEASHSITKAVDLSFDRLITQLKKTKQD